MSWYVVVKTINGRHYRYRQRTWRENGRVRTQSEYIGPAGGERRRGGVTGFLQELAWKDDRDFQRGEMDEQERDRIAGEDAERAKQDRVNDLLSASSISLDAINEIADVQNASAETDSAEADAGSEGAGEGEGEPGGGQ